MQIHPPSAQVGDGEFAVRLHPGGFAIIDVDPEGGHTRLFMERVGDCDRLMAAAAKAKLLLLTVDWARTDLDARLSPPGYSLRAIELTADAGTDAS